MITIEIWKKNLIIFSQKFVSIEAAKDFFTQKYLAQFLEDKISVRVYKGLTRISEDLLNEIDFYSQKQAGSKQAVEQVLSDEVITDTELIPMDILRKKLGITTAVSEKTSKKETSKTSENITFNLFGE